MRFRPVSWHFRRNYSRRSTGKRSSHPSLVVGESWNRRDYLNIGITHSEKRGKHKNVAISDPSDWRKTSYARTDIEMDPKSRFSERLLRLKLNPKDQEKIEGIIRKYEHKKSGGPH